MTFKMTTKFAAATGLTAVILGGLVSPAAHADPIADGSKSLLGQLSGVGSDTTQDVMNGLSIAIGRVAGDGTGVWKLASYDATSDVNNDKIITKTSGSLIYRPNGSGDGRDVLLTAIGQKASVSDKYTYAYPSSGTPARPGANNNKVGWVSSTAVGADNNVKNQIQFSRSSSGPTTNVSTTGAVSYVPFAKDAVDYAVAATSKFPALSVGRDTDAADANHITPNTLGAIYNCAATRIITRPGFPTKLVDNDYTINTAPITGEVSTTIHAYIPQDSSGTGKFWSQKWYNSETATLPSCVKRAGIAGGGHTDVSVQEHDGTVLEGDEGAIMPFSIPKWIGMAKALPGVTDVRHNAVLGTLNGIAPTSGSGQNMVINPTFLTNTSTSFVARTVYNVVPYRLLTDPSTDEYAMFNGRSSLVCSNTATITQYGFGALSATSGPNSCGYAETRAYSMNTPTVTTPTFTANAGAKKYVVAVPAFTTTNGGDMGAKVYVVATRIDGSESYKVNESAPAVIAAGATTVSFDLLWSDLREGTWNLGVEIHPNLTGYSVYGSYGIATKSIVRNETTVSATITGKVKKFGTAVVTVSSDSGTPAGTVTLRKTNASGAILASGDLVSGTVTFASLPKQNKKGNVKVYVEYSGNGDYSAASNVVTWKVK